MEILSKFEGNYRTKTYAKNEVLLSNFQVCKKIFFVNEGLVKLSTYKDGNEFILNFFKENEFCTVIDSLISKTESDCEIIALENTTVSIIDFEILAALSKENQDVEFFLKTLISNSSVALIKRVKELLIQNPEQRYKNFLNQHSNILQRISLGDVAKYVGISQVSLSRIRAKK